MISYRCDLCREPTDREKIVTVQAGARTSGFACGAIDVCPACQARPIADALETLKARNWEPAP